MALQTGNVTMIGLGTRGDTPPNALQPPLGDGVHLRWSFRRSLGFPWYGFFLFRRRHRDEKPRCLSQHQVENGRGARAAASTATTLTTPLGRFGSDRPLAVTDDFPPSGATELDLADRAYLRFDLPPDEPARWVGVRIGFRKQDRRDRLGTKCVGFLDAQPGRGPNPRIVEGLRFHVHDHAGNPAPDSRVRAWGGHGGLDCGYALEITLPGPAPVVELLLSHFGGPATVEAFEDDGASAGTETMQGPQDRPERVRLTGRGLTRVVVRARQNEVLLHEVCAGREVEGGEGGRDVRLTAYSGDVPVAEEWVTADPGRVVNAIVEADAISSVSLSSAPAALVDLCLVPALYDVARGWEPVPECPQPLCLPVAHADYPCPGRPPTRSQAEGTAVGRISYGDPTDWEGARFDDVHEQLEALVDGGPPPPGEPMASRARDFGVDPRLKGQRPLDWVMFASLHPAVAQMVGLYWLDCTVDPDESYDYLVVGDYWDQFHGRPENVLRWLDTHGGDWIQGYVVFNKRMAPAPPLDPPEDVRAYVLPGGTPRAASDPPDATNNVGLRWDTGVVAGTLRPDKAVTYHLWRADLGESTPSAVPADADYHAVTKRPVLVAEPLIPPDASVDRASDWPPFPTHAVDGRLPDGWYSYKASAIDVFGRHSVGSAPGAWFQWAPVPEPRPWYYENPPGHRAVHGFAIQVLDKVPPPPPTAVEAFALDPDDPLLQRDAAYHAWFATLSPTEQQDVVGLRVRWEWTWAHMRQAPDTAEFRIYFNPGTDPPGPDSGVPTAWDTRFYVVPYGDHVTVTTDGDGRPLRRYEVLLPAPGDADRSGLSLPTSQADPIAYAHVGVGAADDKTHTPDDPKWAAGAWGNRPGNEGRVGAPAKIFRVHREAPGPPPVPPPDSDAVYATPADYHGHSFYTYRWQPASNLKTHVFRALDDAVFKTDRRQRPRPALDPEGDPGHRDWFPSESAEPQWNALKRQQVADELNVLNTFPHDEAGTAQAMAHYRGLSNDALRVLAGLPGNERAFTQLTIQPLDPADAANANRPGPDDPPDVVIDPALRAYVGTLDGRGTNRYFYRSAYVDGGHNRSHFSLATVPVYLPNVVPPRAPAVTKVLGGDRQITLRWASNREADLTEYRVYRAEAQEQARDLRLMTHMHTEAVSAGDPSSRPAGVIWIDHGVKPGRTYLYRLTALDHAENESAPSAPIRARAYRAAPPLPPAWVSGVWTDVNAVGVVHLVWTPLERVQVMIQRRTAGTRIWIPLAGWLPAGTTAFDDSGADPMIAHEYRLKGRDGPQWQSDFSDVLVVPPRA